MKLNAHKLEFDIENIAFNYKSKLPKDFTDYVKNKQISYFWYYYLRFLKLFKNICENSLSKFSSVILISNSCNDVFLKFLRNTSLHELDINI